MKKSNKTTRIPGIMEWSGYENDLDIKYMHNLFFGKSADEVKIHFSGGRSIERADELLFCARAVFQYYVHAFVAHLIV